MNAGLVLSGGLLALLTAACSHPAPSAALPLPPPLPPPGNPCPPPVAVPPALSPLHSARDLGDYAATLDAARVAERTRANRCAAWVLWYQGNSGGGGGP